ncbi:xin actin-binding repeat-containing protein 2 [Lissotriton helveticus]
MIETQGAADSVPVREDLQAARRIERFEIPLDSLKMMFEKPTRIVVLPPRRGGKKKEVESEQSLHSPTLKKQSGRYTNTTTKTSDQKGGKISFEKMSSANEEDVFLKGSSESSKHLPDGSVPSSPSVLLDLQDAASLKERMAMYQAAVSKKLNASTNAMEDTETCTVPGGLASMKKQFEKEDITASHNSFAQYQYQHTSVKEIRSSSEVTVQSSSQEIKQLDHSTPTAIQCSALQSEEATTQEQSFHESNISSNFHQDFAANAHIIVDGEIPTISTQALKEQFEKASKENFTPSDRGASSLGKQMKIQTDYQEFEWPPVTSTSTGLASRIHEISATRNTECASAAAYSRSSNFGSTEEFPPPPPDVLQTAFEIADFSQSPEPSISPEKPAVPKEVYSKQRNLYELKRLYKHIHPEVRKNLEKDYFSEVSGIVSDQVDAVDSMSGDVQQARYAFENSSHIPQKCMSPEREYLEWDEILKGEVQSMKWVFENQPLDSIKDDDSSDQEQSKSIPEQEIIAGGDVKYTTWMFETQPIGSLGACSPDLIEHIDKVPELAKGDVQTATWLFETQSIDSMNKSHTDHTSEEAFSKDIASGDVKNVRFLFETQHHDALKQMYSVNEVDLLKLRSESEDFKGDVKRTVKLFETEPMYVLKDSSGQVLEIKTVRREDLEKGDVRTARWMFETQPLDMINHDSTEVKVVRGISMEENIKGGVSKAKWVFETLPLDSIKEDEETRVVEKETIEGADVLHKRWLFETQQIDNVDKTNMETVQAEEILGGDVSTTKYLFETLPMDALKDTIEVGKLQKVITTEEEKGDVRHQRWLFETKPLEQIREENKEYIKTVALDEIAKGDINSCKQVFETIDLTTSDQACKIQVEGITRGAVEINKSLFESTPLYAIQDSIGRYHEVKTIRQEEVMRGDVRTCKWMFETKPIDQFDDSIQNLQIIKGISAEQILSGDVKTGKWLFETQPLASITSFSRVEDGDIKKDQTSDIVKGDVQMCKWLFETQPMDFLYDKEEKVMSTEDISRGDVKTCTWLFETQTLDEIRDQTEKTIRLHTVAQEDIQGRDVREACFLFETKQLENIRGEEGTDYKRVVEMDIQSGDVSTMKYIFENQSLDFISSSQDDAVKKIKTVQNDDIQKGNVLNCRWRFENQSIDDFKEDNETNTQTHTITDVTGGNVKKGCFIFETFSLDQIRDSSSENITVKKVSDEEITKGDVRNYKMLFETQPFYAIQDKEGYYHEVTTVKKEEVIHGDVRGTRWLFETKPLDSINESDEVYLIKAVTQEDIHKGDVSSVRWRFETQSLDTISEDGKVNVHTVDSIQGGDVKAGRELFESDRVANSQSVRTVSVSEIQQGNVKTSTWLFETHTIDELRGQESEYENIKTVTVQDVQKGDVQQAVWLFENYPLDSVQEQEESSIQTSKEEIPQADVKTTTWLFETTPLHEFNDTNIERQEIMGKSIQETLKELYSHNVVDTHGIIIQTDEIGDVRMAKYQLMNQESPEIQREEIIRGDLQSIMMNLLSKRSSGERGVLINEEEKGNVSLAKYNLLNRSTEINVDKEEIVRGDIQQATKNLFHDDSKVKQGILIQKDERGDIKMTVYSLMKQGEGHNILREEVVGGDVKRAIHNLQYSNMDETQSKRVIIDDSERGNVQFYTTCIESGALDYLKLLQTSSDETLESESQQDIEEIIGGDVEGTKLLLKKQQLQIERTVNEDDIIPGDVNNTARIFMTEPQIVTSGVYKEEVVKGDLKATLNSLSQAVHQSAAVAEKEDIIKADIPATLKSLQESTHQVKETEKPDVIPGDVQGAIESLEKAAHTKTEVLREEVLHADIEATKKSLREAQQSIKDVSKEDIVKGDVPMAVQNLLEAASEKKTMQHKVSISGDVKGTIQTLLEPSHQEAKRCVQDTIKSLLESTAEVHTEKEIIPKSDIKSTIKKFSGQAVQNMDTSKHVKNVKVSRDLQHVVTEKADILEDKSEIKSQRCQEPGFRDAHQFENDMHLSGTVINETTTNISGSHTIIRKESASSVQKMAVEKQQFHGALKENDSDKVAFDVQKEKGGQKEAMSTCMSASKAEQQPVHIKHSAAVRLSDHSVKQMTKQETSQAGHFQKATESCQICIQPGQSVVSVTMDNNVRSNQQTKVIQKAHNVVSETKITQKTGTIESKKHTTDVLGKTKVKATSVDSKTEIKKSFNPIKARSGNPGPPTLPKPSPILSEAELPLPPPPPLVMASERPTYSPLPPPPLPICKTKADYDSFPPPPPPVDDASSSESGISPPPPPPPPTVMQQKVDYHIHSSSSSAQSQIKDAKSDAKPTMIPYSKKVSKVEHNKQILEGTLTHESHVSTQFIGSQTTKSTTEASTVVKQINAASSTQKQDAKHAKTEHENVLVEEKSGRLLQSPVQDLPSVKRRVVLPTIKSPPSPSLASPPKSKPYARKFKTPLMIAEERYRQQQEELDRMKATSTCHGVSITAEEAQESQAQTESKLSGSLTTKSISYGSSSSQSSGLQTTSQISSDSKTQVTTQQEIYEVNKPQSAAFSPPSAIFQQQNIKHSTERRIRQDEPQDMSHFRHDNLVMETSHSQEKLKKIEQRSETASPKFNVKVVKLPAPVSCSPEPKKENKTHTTVKEIGVEIAEKDLRVKKQSEKVCTTVSQEIMTQGRPLVDAGDKHIIKSKHMKHEDLSKGGSQHGRQDIRHIQKQKANEMEATQVQFHHDNAALSKDLTQQQVTFAKHEHTVQSKQGHTLDISMEKVTRQSNFKVGQESQIHLITQKQTCAPESKTVHTKLMQQHAFPLEKTVTEKATKEGALLPALDIRQDLLESVSYDSQVHMMQQSVTEEKVQKTKLPLLQKKQLDKSKQEKDIKDVHTTTKPKNVKQEFAQINGHESQIHIIQQVQPHAPESKDQATKLPQQQKYIIEKSKIGIKQEESCQRQATDVKQELSRNRPSIFPTKALLVEARGSIEILEYLRKREELQHILSKVKEFEAEPHKINTTTFQTFLNSIPIWLINQEGRKSLDNYVIENDSEKLKTAVMLIKDQALETYSSCETAMHNAMMSMSAKSKQASGIHQEASNQISQIFKTSNKSNIQIKHETPEDSEVCREMKMLSSELGSRDHKLLSPSLKMRSPSPTYITIESTARRTESPLKETPSSSPVPQPPRRAATPTPRRKRSSPSPPRSRSEQLAKLKDTTAKLSQGATPQRSVTPIPIVEKRSEIVQSPATLRRQLKIEAHSLETLSTTPDPPFTEFEVTAGTVKDIKTKRNEVSKVEQNRTYTRKDPIDIPIQLEPKSSSTEMLTSQSTEMPTVDISGLLYKFESTDKPLNVRNVPIAMAERIRSENQSDINTIGTSEGMPAFDIRSVRNVFENSNQNKCSKNEKHTFMKEEFGISSQEQIQGKGSSRGPSHRQPQKTKEAAHMKQDSALRKKSDRERASDPLLRHEQFTGMESFEMVGSRTATTASGSFENLRPGFEFRHAPPTYEDVISGHSLDISAADSPEELLRNFQKTWQESERVFKSLGYTVSEASASETRSSFVQQESAFTAENSTSGAGNMFSVSKDSLSDGMPGGRQADLP